MLLTRLQIRGINPSVTLMVGDRLDNDIEPARAQGCQTWQLTGRPGVQSGNWRELLQRLKKRD